MPTIEELLASKKLREEQEFQVLWNGGAREEREAVLKVIYSRSLGVGQVSSPEHPDRPSVPVLLVPVAVLQALGRGERFEAGEHRKEGAPAPSAARPEPGSSVLAWVDGEWLVAEYHGAKGGPWAWDFDTWGLGELEVAHWRPLPPPPVEQKEGA